MTPVVSVVMPAFNAAKYLQQSIDTVRDQTFTDWELIIVNDGSSDSTLAIAQENRASDNRIIVIDQMNKKQGAARNAGLRVCRGEWIAFLDADDLWSPNKLLRQLEFQAHADVLFTGGVMWYEGTQEKKSYPIITGFFESSKMFKLLFEKNPIANLSVMMNRKWIGIAGLQNESMDVVGCEDWEYWIRLAKNGASFYGMPDELFFYRIHGGGTSQNGLKMKMAELYAKVLNADKALLTPDLINSLVTQFQSTIGQLLWYDKKEEARKVMHFLSRTGFKQFALTNRVLNLMRLFPGKFIFYMTRPAYIYKRLTGVI